MTTSFMSDEGKLIELGGQENIPEQITYLAHRIRDVAVRLEALAPGLHEYLEEDSGREVPDLLLGMQRLEERVKALEGSGD